MLQIHSYTLDLTVTFKCKAVTLEHLIYAKKSLTLSLGTKLDLDYRRQVDHDAACKLADHFKWQYVEMSAADQTLTDLVSLFYCVLNLFAKRQ